MTKQGQGLGLEGVLGALRRRLGVVLLCALLVPVSTLGFSLSQKKQYTVSASLLFRDPAFDQKLFGAQFLAPSKDPAREAATNLKLVSLEVVAQRTAKRIAHAVTTDAVRRKVEVSGEGESDLVSVKATDGDPRFAARLANTFAEEYVAFRREADRSKIREAQQLVEGQLAQTTGRERNGARAGSLEQRIEQLRVFASLQTGNAELVQPARPPTAPSSPKPIRNAVLGGFLGLLLGVGLALLLNRLDRRIRDPEEIKAIFDRPILGAVRQSRALARSPVAAAKPLPAGEAEAFRMLRANLRYFNVDRPIRSVLVTSAAPGDGKSTVTWNLAAATAQAGGAVLLIEADLRHPSLASPANDLWPAPGLSNVLSGQTDVSEAIQTTAVGEPSEPSSKGRTMDVLVAGPLPPNPADLVESERMRSLLRDTVGRYDLVVIDTPPTSVVSDAIPLINEVDGVIVVARLGKSTRDSAVHLCHQLEQLNAHTLGIVMNGFRADGAGYGYGYGYGDSYRASRDHDTGVLEGEPAAPNPPDASTEVSASAPDTSPNEGLGAGNGELPAKHRGRAGSRKQR